MLHLQLFSNWSLQLLRLNGIHQLPCHVVRSARRIHPMATHLGKPHKKVTLHSTGHIWHAPHSNLKLEACGLPWCGTCHVSPPHADKNTGWGPHTHGLRDGQHQVRHLLCMARGHLAYIYIYVCARVLNNTGRQGTSIQCRGTEPMSAPLSVHIPHTKQLQSITALINNMLGSVSAV